MAEEGCGAPRLKSWPDLALVFVLSLFFGTIHGLRFVAAVLWKGPTRMFCNRARNVRPEVLKSSDYGTHTFVRLKKSRVTLHCVVDGPADKPLMLFLHGFPELWYSWRHQMKEFSKDYRVVAVDMRGYGESSKPARIADYTLDRLAGDVDELIGELGYEAAASVVSHDWGAVVGFALAAVYPHRVGRLVVANVPHPKTFETYVRTTVSQLRKSWYIFVWQWPVLPELILHADNMAFVDQIFTDTKIGYGAKQGFSPQDLEAFKYAIAGYHDCSAPINYYRAFMRYESPNVEEALNAGKISVPTLIVWGKQDAFLEWQMAELSTGRIEECSVEYMDGVSHWVQQEEPQKFNAILRQYLDKQLHSS